ncbi:UNVERIFIED_CONTAM: hypothetical protein O8I53_06060 [Campylobacter lari]
MEKVNESKFSLKTFDHNELVSEKVEQLNKFVEEFQLETKNFGFIIDSKKSNKSSI